MTEEYGQRGRKYKPQKSGATSNDKYSGIGDDEKFSGGPPYAHLISNPKDTSPYQPVTFDASKSHDATNNPCKSFMFNFGDGSPPKTQNSAIIEHPYAKAGTYPVKVTAIDKNGLTADATINQRVSGDPSFGASNNEPNAPYAVVNSTPTNAKPSQPVTIDASESQDIDAEPCKNFVFDFGDGTPPVETTKPVINHAFSEPGTYPV
eukprot:264257_1